MTTPEPSVITYNRDRALARLREYADVICGHGDLAELNIHDFNGDHMLHEAVERLVYTVLYDESDTDILPAIEHPDDLKVQILLYALEDSEGFYVLQTLSTTNSPVSVAGTSEEARAYAVGVEGDLTDLRGEALLTVIDNAIFEANRVLPHLRRLVPDDTERN